MHHRNIPAKSMALFSLGIGLCISLSGCAGQTTNTTSTPDPASTIAAVSEASTAAASEEIKEDASTEEVTAEENTTTANTTEDTSDGQTSNDYFTKRDLKQTADLDSAKTLTVTSGEETTISEEGVYILKGTGEDATVIVDAPDDAKIQLVLDGVRISNSSKPVIYVKNADKVFITTTSTENTLAVTGEFEPDGDTNLDAVIFAKDDLVLNGTGTLTITSTQGHGISGHDEVKITGGTYAITSGKHGIEAKDELAICDGTFTINASKDGIHCADDDDDTKGSIYISGGSFTIDAKSDGIQGITTLTIDGGEFNIQASEGLEATELVINDGSINISASDDGINASYKSSQYSPSVTFNGGSTTISMGAGDTDGVDANGSIYVYGGTLSVTGQSTFDYDKEGILAGGTVYVNGEQVTELPNQFGGGGPGGHGGFGGFGKTPNGNSNNFQNPPAMPENGNMPQDFQNQDSDNTI